MKRRNEKNLPFFLSVAIVLTVTVAICVCVLSCSGGTLDFSASYYLVCCYVKDDVLSADALSPTVSSYGGAGYVFEFGGAYYVTIACYYSENDANTVNASLKRRELDCTVVCAERDDYSLPRAAQKNAALYAGNLNTLQSLARLAYECANGLDTGAYSQTAAKSVLSDIASGLSGLKSANKSNCFTDEIARLSAECDAVAQGYIFSKDMRRLQIAVADCILHINLT